VKADPILEELWKIKDDLAREAGYDAHRFMENLRRWEAEHPLIGRVVRSAEDLRQYAEEEERQRAEDSAMALNDKPPRKP
jgi:hypothetical protein